MSAADRIRELITIWLDQSKTYAESVGALHDFNNYMFNNAEAIAELIEASEHAYLTGISSPDARTEIRDALAKLNHGTEKNG